MAALAQSSAFAAVASVPTAGAVASGSKPAQAKSLAFNGLKSASTSLQAAALTSDWSSKTVANTARVQCMKVWEPYNNTKFETLSYLPALSDTQIAAQIQYLLNNGWIPTIEFDKVGVPSGQVGQFSGYYDGRYWVMWKLPMFGCTDPAQVLQEISECKSLYPDCFIRVIGFDNTRQVQCAAFIVHKPQ